MVSANGGEQTVRSNWTLTRSPPGLISLFEPLILLVPAITWGFTPILYKPFLEKRSAITINFLRTTFASCALLVPLAIFGFSPSLSYGALSGLLTLAIGDTLFFVSIGLVGASIATPLLYVQTVLIQFVAPSVGEPLSAMHLLSAALIVVAVFLLSRGDGSTIRLKGIAVGLLAAGVESVGQSFIKAATLGGANAFSIAFSRTATATVALCVILLLTKRRRGGTIDNITSLTWRDGLTLGAVSILDIAFAAGLYVYSVGIVGIVFSTIVLGLSPLITQMASRALRRESPKSLELLAGALIVLAVTITVL